MINHVDYSVVIICPHYDIGALKYTVTSVKCIDDKKEHFAVVDKEVSNIDYRDMSRYCKVHKAGFTVSSLMNEGIRLSSKDWCLVVVAGAWLRRAMLKKYSYFCNSEKDIIYPVVDKKYLFDEASINGILINKNSFMDIGDFGNSENFSEVKLQWAANALHKNYKLKAVVGVRF